MIELLDCPFCATDKQYLNYNISTRVIECGCCGAAGPDRMGNDVRDEAAEAWNMRSADGCEDRVMFEVAYEKAWPMSCAVDRSKFSRSDASNTYNDGAVHIGWTMWQAGAAIGSHK